MDKSIFTNKKILFYGPANTNDKETLDINYFDYVIITNNMVNIFFYKYKNLSCKIIHLSNQLYSLKYLDTIKKYTNNIEIILVVGKGYEFLKKNINNVNIHYIKTFTEIEGVPLGLSRILNLLCDQKFKELYITGVTFYSGNKIEDCYENNYILKEGKEFNIFKKDKNTHNIPSNIKYTRKICDSNKNISMCKELHNILYNQNVQNKPRIN